MLENKTSIYVLWNRAVVALSLLSLLLHFIILGLNYSAAEANIPLLLAIVIGGVPLVIQLIYKVLHGDFGTDMLAALSFITGVWLGQYLAAMLIILMLSGGQVLEGYAMRKASSTLLALAKRMPFSAHRKKGDAIEEVSLADIAIGDEIVIYPYETAPIDGVVVSGNGSMDESYLTGEPYLVAKAPGAAVMSGAINGDAVLSLRAEKLADDSRYAQIMKVMQEAEQKRPKIRRLGDEIGAIFAPVALVLALAAWYISGDSIRFLAVLVVATPCPLLIAIPVTLISAISMAARRGIIIKDPTVLERLPTCRTAIFDKTGTLTYGKPELTEIITAKGVARNKVLQRVASIERYSKHPLANAILQEATKENLKLIDATSVSEKPGQGLTGMVDKYEISITHRNKLSPEVTSLLPPTKAGLECIILMNGKYAATFYFRDTPRKGGKSFIEHLAPMHQFKKIMLVSGDRQSEVSYLAELLGIKETTASQSPEEKVAIVRAETAKAPTLFMGDGINDAPAIASATVGLAFGSYSSVTAEAAGAVILVNSLVKVDELLHISIQMRTILLQSAVGGMVLSIIAMGFAAFGYITPVAGALLQEAIDVVVIVNALRLTVDQKVEIDFKE